MALDPDTLSRAPAFAALPDDARAAMALCFRGRRYATGEIVFREGDPASSLFFVADGEVAVSERAPGGGTRQLERLGKGRLAGEDLVGEQVHGTAGLRAPERGDNLAQRATRLPAGWGGSAARST